METQKDWDSPVDDFNNSDDFANSNDFADNLSIADLSIDADSAQSPLDSGLPHDKRSGAANHRRWIALLAVLAMIIAGAAGFAWRRDRQGNPTLLCDSESGRVDALDYCYEGFEPLQPSGERLTLADAGPYFAKAVDNTYAADDAVRIAAAGGDKDTVHKAAATAHDRAQQAAEIVDQANPTGHYRIPGMRVVLCESDGQSQCRGHRLDSVRAVPGIRRATADSHHP